MSKRVSRDASGITNRPQTVAMDASRRAASRGAVDGDAKSGLEPLQPPSSPPRAAAASSPKRASAPGSGSQ
eukprot:CAMPEP_0173413536 /NCGR_PEP_ID=MMETSP1356-20130122/82308_1 /TAXON_ID=77927 ORGANISM="Hemiselmis virescens, Strain PCC157" /NCGR_SAMPLE_ID=MMETSP1356 /ASSEMBLY_ACC=CAM_ASM_000847 /LENGTH=70 /DNA_ID=CAMNT_0014375591 /DNA_START=131 /DNA_END=340 /DNA_ORIENTATION=+